MKKVPHTNLNRKTFADILTECLVKVTTDDMKTPVVENVE